MQKDQMKNPLVNNIWVKGKNIFGLCILMKAKHLNTHDRVIIFSSILCQDEWSECWAVIHRCDIVLFLLHIALLGLTCCPVRNCWSFLMSTRTSAMRSSSLLWLTVWEPSSPERAQSYDLHNTNTTRHMHNREIKLCCFSWSKSSHPTAGCPDL